MLVCSQCQEGAQRTVGTWRGSFSPMWLREDPVCAEADPSSKATLWVKAQHEGALPPPCTHGPVQAEFAHLWSSEGGFVQLLMGTLTSPAPK